jgi:hypothetical protein
MDMTASFRRKVDKNLLCFPICHPVLADPQPTDTACQDRGKFLKALVWGKKVARYVIVHPGHL